ncbi:MAG: hypothetical protein PHX87_00795 [Candidatus Peribacteraceae bacterium]|nr:hypothetical protein [Candidatus Peribacteraceae bacterium]
MSQDATKQAYEKMLNKPLSDEELLEAQDNLLGFFSVLIEIDRDLRASPTSDGI